MSHQNVDTRVLARESVRILTHEEIANVTGGDGTTSNVFLTTLHGPKDIVIG